MRDRRKDSVGVLFLRGLFFLVGAVVAVCLFGTAGSKYGNPSSEIERFKPNPTLPRVLVRGTVARRPNDDLPPLCKVEHEHYQSCGKHYCWRQQEGFRNASGTLTVEWSSSPLPATMVLDSAFHEEAWSFPGIVVDSSRAESWKHLAQKHNLGFSEDSFHGPSSDRIVEYCADTGDPIYLSACLSPTNPNRLERCPGEADYGVVYDGDDQAARDDGADEIAGYVGGGIFALLVAALAWVRTKKPIVEGLEDRAAPHKRGLGWAWGILGVAPAVGLGALMITAQHPPSSYASGRGGFAIAIIATAAWFFFMMTRLRYRGNLLAALQPVLATERKPLAQASGTTELSVKAKLRDGGVRAFIGDDVVAYSEITIWETYSAGKNVNKQVLLTSRQRNEVGVTDESGDGTLDLRRSILDVELREQRLRALSPRYAERGVVVSMHPRHIEYVVKESVIKDGESLFVFGDVSGIALQSDEGGYRTVRGSPTLGGADAAPVLVYSGSQRGLVDMLSREARIANSMAVVAICLCGAMALSMFALAML